MHNPDCDGNGPHDAGEARVLPLPGRANLNLCARCFARELRWRYERNRGLGREARYSLPTWESLARLREPIPSSDDYDCRRQVDDTGYDECRFPVCDCTEREALPDQDSRTQADGASDAP